MPEEDKRPTKSADSRLVLYVWFCVTIISTSTIGFLFEKKLKNFSQTFTHWCISAPDLWDMWLWFWSIVYAKNHCKKTVKCGEGHGVVGLATRADSWSEPAATFTLRVRKLLPNKLNNLTGTALVKRAGPYEVLCRSYGPYGNPTESQAGTARFGHEPKY